MAIEKPTLKAAIDAVHKRHLKITAHLCSVTYREAAEMGIDQLEHGFIVSSDFAKDKKRMNVRQMHSNLLAIWILEMTALKT